MCRGDGHSLRPLHCRSAGKSGAIGQITDGIEKEGVQTLVLETLVQPEVADVDSVTGRLREIGLRAGDFV